MMCAAKFNAGYASDQVIATDIHYAHNNRRHSDMVLQEYKLKPCKQ